MRNQKLQWICVFILSTFSFSRCTIAPAPAEAPSKLEKLLGGTHPLRRMMNVSETNSSLSGGYFMFFGGIHGQSQTEQIVKFAWLMNDSVSYAISSLPLEKIRIQFSDTISVPTIKYCWHRLDATDYMGRGSHTLEEYMSNCVTYAVVTVKEEDWEVKLDLPLSANDTLR